MTLINKNWLKNEALRLYLSGESQENIAKRLSISAGTVNSFVNEIITSDDSIELQRQIAIVANKNDVNIKQIAANLRWKNKIKQCSLDDKKIEKLLDGLNMLFNKHNISPSTGANQLCSIIEAMLRFKIEPDRLEEEIISKNDELKRIIGEIENRNKELEETNKELEETMTRVEKKQAQLRVKEKDLEQFHNVSQALELYGYPDFCTEYGKVARAMIDFRKLGCDPKVIVGKYEKSESLTKMNGELEAKLKESENALEYFRRRVDEEKTKSNNYQSFNCLLKDGLSSEDILDAVSAFKNDFPEVEGNELVIDDRTYQSLMEAKLKLQRQIEAQTDSTS